MKTLIKYFIGVAFCAAAVGASAGTCTTDSFALTAAAPTGQALVSTGTIFATSCFGVTNDPKNVGSLGAAQPNLGYLGDGLLNGQGGYVSPTQFVTSSQLLALNPATPGQKIDPGWIELGSFTGANSASMTAAQVTAPGSSTPFDLSSVVSYSQQTGACPANSPKGAICGTWTLTVNANTLNILASAGLFERSTFDQLAFEVKAGDGYAIYDFNFAEIGGFANVPYTFSGTWNLDDFRNKPDNADQNISDFVVWARDPLGAPPTNNVPEPGSLALCIVALAATAVATRRRKI